MQTNIGDLRQEASGKEAQIKETIADIDQRIDKDLSSFQSKVDQKISALNENFSTNIESISGQVESEADFNEETKAQINSLFSRVDEITEKLYEFEINKKNNLIFYGISGENRETPSVLIMKAERTFVGKRKLTFCCLDQLDTEADSVPEERHRHH